MPESVEVCAGSPKKDESPAPSGEVRWEVEDPSEFRPDILSDMGKDETEFRVFNVSARTHKNYHCATCRGCGEGVSEAPSIVCRALHSYIVYTALCGK